MQRHEEERPDKRRAVRDAEPESYEASGGENSSWYHQRQAKLRLVYALVPTCHEARHLVRYEPSNRSREKANCEKREVCETDLCWIEIVRGTAEHIHGKYAEDDEPGHERTINEGTENDAGKADKR